jgi:predicted membrane metal-binding protein
MGNARPERTSRCHNYMRIQAAEPSTSHTCQTSQLHHDHQQYTPLFTFLYPLILSPPSAFLFLPLISLRIPTLLLFTRKASRTNTPATGICIALFFRVSLRPRRSYGKDREGIIRGARWNKMHGQPAIFLLLCTFRSCLGSWRYWRWAATREHSNVCASQAHALLFSFSLVATIPMTFSLESEALCLNGERF